MSIEESVVPALGAISETPQTPEEMAAPQEEQAPKPEAVEAPKDDRFAAKFAALGRKEKEVKAREKAYAEKEAALAKRAAELEERSKGDQTFKDTFAKEFKANPLKVMAEYGITYDEVSEMVLNEQNPTTDMKMRRMQEELESKTTKELEALKKQLADKEAKEIEREKQQAQARFDAEVNGYKESLKKALEADAEKYEISNLQGEAAVNLALEVGLEYFYSTCGKDEEGNIILNDQGLPAKPGKTLSTAEVLEEVEKYYEEQARPLTKLKKFQQTSPKDAQPKESKETAPTLSNTLAAEVPRNGSSRLSDEQSLAEAAKLIRWIE